MILKNFKIINLNEPKYFRRIFDNFLVLENTSINRNFEKILVIFKFMFFKYFNKIYVKLYVNFEETVKNEFLFFRKFYMLQIFITFGSFQFRSISLLNTLQLI